MSSKINCFKDNVKPADWVGHSQLISLHTNDFFKIKTGVDQKQASETGNKIKQSISGIIIHFYYKKKKKT